MSILGIPGEEVIMTINALMSNKKWRRKVVFSPIKLGLVISKKPNVNYLLKDRSINESNEIDLPREAIQ
jgi:hypothetical protein